MSRRMRQAGPFALALMAACAEPKPTYPPIEQPMAGTILAEMSLITTGGAQQIDMAADEETSQARLSVHLPAGAYPAGTKVTARLVDGLTMPVDSCIVLTLLLSHWGSSNYLALQILPQQPPPAVPLRVAYHPSVDRWAYQVLHAEVGDAAWTVAETFEPSPSGLSFAITKPGLWTVGQLHFPPALQGRLQRTEVTCGNGTVVANDPPVVVDVTGDSFSWAQPSADTACYKVATGRLVGYCASDWQAKRFTLQPGIGMSILIDRHALDDGGTGIWWERNGLSSECGSRALQREHFVLLGASATPPVPLTDAGTCPVDASRDGGRD